MIANESKIRFSVVLNVYLRLVFVHWAQTKKFKKNVILGPQLKTKKNSSQKIKENDKGQFGQRERRAINEEVLGRKKNSVRSCYQDQTHS